MQPLKLVEYLIYCDESIAKGKYFSNFYGGALVHSQDLEEIEEALQSCRDRLRLDKEMKWSKVTTQYLDKYLEVTSLFFDFVESDKIKIRIMFTQNLYEPSKLTVEQKNNEYFLLYYQFIKHAFGLAYADDSHSQETIKIRLYLDKLPDTKEKAAQFKQYLVGLNEYKQFKNRGIYIDPQQIAEVTSHQHKILQGLDIVLGSIQFRLNDGHKEKPEGARFRGKRTIAKERLYRHINQRIRQIYPRFNIGVSTGIRDDLVNRWRDQYRHWLFIPSEYDLNLDITKSSHK
jgi:hypothetical protein